MASAGILGAAAGLGKAVSQISQEERKNLAERLKMKALEEMNMRMAGVEHGYAMERQNAQIGAQKEMQGEQIGAQKEMAANRIQAQKDMSQAGLEGQMAMNRERLASGEKMNTERLHSQEKIAGMQSEIQRELMKSKEDTTKSSMLKTQAKAAADAMNIINKGGTMDEANAILQAAELPLLEEYVIDPGKKGGWFGIGEKEPTIGYRMPGTKGMGILSSNADESSAEDMTPGQGGQPSKLKQDLDRLLKSGMESSPDDEAYTNIPDELERPGDKNSINIIQRGSKFYIKNNDGTMREATPEEIQKWRNQSGMKGILESSITGTKPQPRRGGEASTGVMPKGRGY